MPSPLRGRASTAPVTELRMYSKPGRPESSRAFTPPPPGSWPAGLPSAAIRRRALGARGHVEPRLDHAVVAQRDAGPRVRAEQATLADRDDLGTAAGQGAHDRRARADVTAVVDHDAGHDP